MSGKRSHAAYDSLWSSVIEPALRGYVCEDVRLRGSAKDDVWQAYVALNRHASETYMEDPEGLLDRHKVAACYTYAILLAMPLIVGGGSVANHLNERVALYTGCSVLASFLVQAVKQAPGFDEVSRSRVCERIGMGVDFPRVGHGRSYVENALNCLAFTQIEQNYNVLLLALLYYDWELRLMDSSDHELVTRHYSNKMGRYNT